MSGHQTRKYLIMPFLLLLGSVVVQACSQGSRPFLIAQVCLHNEADVGRFIDLMRGIARSNGMEFVDRSEQAARELSEVGAGLESEQRPTFVYVGTVGNEDYGFSAGNLGMPGHQVSIAFTSEHPSNEARQLAAATVKKLREFWKVETQSGAIGARGMAEC